MTEKSDMLRHLLASLAYHATKAIKAAPSNYSELDIGDGARTPKQVLRHITSVMTYAHSFYEHYDSTILDYRSWEEEVKRFYEILALLDHSIQNKSPNGVSEEQILQGPFSDAMAHIGQLLMLRRKAGSPVPSENFIYADIKKGVLGPNQPDPVAPDR